MPNHTLIYGGGDQVIALVPARVPGAATYGVGDLRYSEGTAEHVVVAAGEPAAVDAVATTLTLAAGRGADRRVVTLASIAGVQLGMSYEIQDARGQREVVIAEAINAGAKTVRARAEVQHEYASGSAFRGAEVRATIPAAWSDSEEVFRAGGMAVITWRLSGTTPAVIRETIALERARTQLATVQDVVGAVPTLAQGRSGRTDLATALTQAHAHYQTDLRLHGINPDAHHAGAVGHEAVKILAVMYAVKSSSDTSDVALHSWAYDRYQEIRAGLAVGRDKQGVVETDRTSDSAKPIDYRQLVRIGW